MSEVRRNITTKRIEECFAELPDVEEVRMAFVDINKAIHDTAQQYGLTFYDLEKILEQFSERLNSMKG